MPPSSLVQYLPGRVDVLIVGQGLAGTLLAERLMAAGKTVLVIDDGHRSAATRAAAGMISPIAGQRFAPAWRFSEAWAVAERRYRELETRWGVPLWHPCRLRRLFADEAERDRFARRAAEGLRKPWPAEIGLEWAGAAEEPGGVRAPAGSVRLSPAAWVDLPRVLEHASTWLNNGGARAEAAVAAGEIEMTPEGVRWGKVHARRVVWCTGAAALPWRDAFTAGLPLQRVKGETVRVRAPGVEPGEILSQGVWLQPRGGGEAWIGATYEPRAVSPGPTAAGSESLLSAVKAFWSGPLFPLESRAGVRLAVPDQRPLVGFHPAEERIGFFLGLGSKGALWAPWLAERWVAALETGAALPRESDVRRFV